MSNGYNKFKNIYVEVRLEILNCLEIMALFTVQDTSILVGNGINSFIKIKYWEIISFRTNYRQFNQMDIIFQLNTK